MGKLFLCFCVVTFELNFNFKLNCKSDDEPLQWLQQLNWSLKIKSDIVIHSSCALWRRWTKDCVTAVVSATSYASPAARYPLPINLAWNKRASFPYHVTLNSENVRNLHDMLVVFSHLLVSRWSFVEHDLDGSQVLGNRMFVVTLCKCRTHLSVCVFELRHFLPVSVVRQSKITLRSCGWICTKYSRLIAGVLESSCGWICTKYSRLIAGVLES